MEKNAKKKLKVDSIENARVYFASLREREQARARSGMINPEILKTSVPDSFNIGTVEFIPFHFTQGYAPNENPSLPSNPWREADTKVEKFLSERKVAE
jgi:hypothetical protein